MIDYVKLWAFRIHHEVVGGLVASCPYPQILELILKKP